MLSFQALNLLPDSKPLQIDFTKPIDISLPLLSGEEAVNCYYAAPVQYETISVGDFVGSTLQGGSCNYQRVSLTPHGNGTHTECYGHLSTDGATINQCLKQFVFVALLVSLPTQKNELQDDYVALAALQQQIQSTLPTFLNSLQGVEALLIRTLPHDESKRQRHYSGTNPPYLEPEIGNFLKDHQIKHLLLDLPSVDKEWDNGALSAHRNFWNLLPRHQTTPTEQIRKDCTITELIYVPPTIKDGLYLLNLQIASFESDASPSKPILYAFL